MTDAMFMPAYVAAVALSAAALVRHFHDAERRRAGLAAFVWTATSAARPDAASELHVAVLFSLDALLVLFLVGLAWRARSAWPTLAAFVQAIGAAALLASLTDGRVTGDLHLTVSTIAAHLTAGVLLAGAWLQGERQRLRPRALAASLTSDVVAAPALARA